MTPLKRINLLFTLIGALALGCSDAGSHPQSTRAQVGDISAGSSLPPLQAQAAVDEGPLGPGLPAEYGLPGDAGPEPASAGLAAALPIVSGRIGVLGTWNGVATFYPRSLVGGVKAHVFRNGGWITTTLPGKADGTYAGSLDLLPGESYWVEGPSIWTYTKDTFVDQATPRSMRPGLVANTQGGPSLTATLTNLQPLANGDRFEVGVPGHPYRVEKMNLDGSGATSLAWTFTTNQNGEGAPLKYQVASPEDTVHVTGLKRQVLNGSYYWGLTRLRRVGLSAKDGDILSFNVSMSNALASSETVSAHADFGALRARATDGLSLRFTPALTKTAYFPGEEGGLEPVGLQNFAILRASGSDNIGAFSVGKLYDAWPKGFELSSALQRTVLAPGAQTSSEVWVNVLRRQTVAPTAQTKLGLTLGQPTGATLGEGLSTPLTSDQTGVGLTPRLDWTITGSPTASYVEVHEIYSEGGRTRSILVGRLRSWRTVHQRIPPGILKAGHSYVFTVSVESGASADFPQRTPLKPGTVYERTGIVSGVIQP